MSTTYSDLIQTGLNTNSTSTVTDALDIRGNTLICFGAKNVSGAHSNHVLTLQQSLDGVSWANTAYTLTGLGIVDNIQTAVRFVRVKCTTEEGGASVVDIIIQAK